MSLTIGLRRTRAADMSDTARNRKCLVGTDRISGRINLATVGDAHSALNWFQERLEPDE